MEKHYYVYIPASQKNGTLYIGVTSDPARRIWLHREGLIEGFTKQYGVKRLVYIELLDDPTSAIAREKAMKKWRRTWKIELIERGNPEWDDLYLRMNW
jgi:putative endonuclease